ncbi:MAG: hypothetical protein KIT09_33885, partial [Bryobacteraceae bacterium]|nr:hypothetical protein [Bryobacteraceae bacterium]
VYASNGWVHTPAGFGYGADENNTLDTVYLLVTPDASEEMTFTATGLRYGGRLTYLYIYRFGGLKVTE